MNLNRIIVISLFVLMFSSYQTDSSILFTLLMKLLMIKGAIFMSMPLSIGAFVMGQGMGFFAGNMMGGYMMLRAANRYHHKEKAKWTTYSGWHGPPFNTDNYARGYQKGKAISNVLNAANAKVNAIASIFKPFIPSTTRRPPKGWSSSPPKYGPPPPPPPPSYGPPKGWSTDYTYASYTDPSPTYGAPPPPPPLPPSVMYGHPPTDYQEYYPAGNRKNGFSSVLTNTLYGGNKFDDDGGDVEKIRRVFNAPSPSGFYTSAYKTPGQEFTGILTNEPTSQGDKYLRGEPSDVTESSVEASTRNSIVSSATPPNDILESYLEQRLKAEAEKQRDQERKQEALQILQLLRKAYLKNLVDSLKEEELAQKTKTNRRLETSPFASLSSSIESLFGSRETRSMERKEDNEVGNSVSPSPSTRNLIRDLLINEVFTSSSTARSVETDKPDDDQLDTQELASITERIMGLSSTEREELVRGLDEIDQNQEDDKKDEMMASGSSVEQVIAKPMLTLSDADYADSLLRMIASTENAIITSKEKLEEIRKKRRSEGKALVEPAIPPAMWVPVDNAFSSEANANGQSTRVRRQTGSGQGSLSQASQAAAGGAGNGENSAEAQKQVQAFVDDIRKFFTLLSALDQDKCLQKLVCDVHTNEKDTSTLTQYEQNILTTFKLMKALMPEGEEDSSTKYRYAALVGETGQSMDLCQQTFSTCNVDSSKIVELGSQQPEDGSGLPVDLSAMQMPQQQPQKQTPKQDPTVQNPPSSSSTTKKPASTTEAAPEAVQDSEESESGTQRRNYVETHQYYDQVQQVRRRRPQPQVQHQQYHRESQYQHQPDQHRNQYQNQQQYPSSGHRHQQYQPVQPHPIRPNRYPSRDDVVGEPVERRREPPPRRPSRPPPPPPPGVNKGSNVWDYGEFSDFFRSMWSDTMMRGNARRSQRKLWHNLGNSRRYWRNPTERIEELGI